MALRKYATDSVIILLRDDFRFRFFLNNILGWHTAQVPRDDLHFK